MQKHVQVYFRHFGYSIGDFILCENCTKKEANDIHHVIFRSKFGSKTKDQMNEISNLVALCRDCHDKVHVSGELKAEELKIIVEKRSYCPTKIAI